jgi:hypothetical protein
MEAQAIQTKRDDDARQCIEAAIEESSRMDRMLDGVRLTFKSFSGSDARVGHVAARKSRRTQPPPVDLARVAASVQLVGRRHPG